MGLTFADRLRLYRLVRGLSQGELARRVGLNYSTLSHYERGTRYPSADAVRKLARALELGPRKAAELVAAAGYGFGTPFDVDLVAIGLALSDPRLPGDVRERVVEALAAIRREVDAALDTRPIPDDESRVRWYLDELARLVEEARALKERLERGEEWASALLVELTDYLIDVRRRIEGGEVPREVRERADELVREYAAVFRGADAVVG